VPNDSNKRKRNRSTGQTQIAVSMEVDLLARIKVRAKSLERSISGHLRFLALRDLEAAENEKEARGEFPPNRIQAHLMSDKPRPPGK
jgi:hypothetical protein